MGNQCCSEDDNSLLDAVKSSKTLANTNHFAFPQDSIMTPSSGLMIPNINDSDPDDEPDSIAEDDYFRFFEAIEADDVD